MTGGTISGNTASGSSSGHGGGVYGSVDKTGGIIYGNNAAEGLKNTANDTGHAVYLSDGKYRDTTAGESVSLDSSTSDNWNQ